MGAPSPRAVLSRGSTTECPTTRIILGIDPGYERCGFAVLERNEGGTENLLFSSCFMTPAGVPFPDRLVQIGKECKRLLAVYHPTLCALEKVYFTSNQKTAMRVAEVRGMLLFLAAAQGIPLCEYTPNEIKVAVAGDGRGSKEQVTYMIPRLVRLIHEVRYDDEYDAIAVALTASAISRTPLTATDHRTGTVSA